MEQSLLSILQESLAKKSGVLDRLLSKNEEQTKILEQTPFSMESFDVNTDEKAALIEELLQLDEGFALLYERLKVYLDDQETRTKHTQDIRRLQGRIAEITQKSISLEAQEARNKTKMEQILRTEKEKIRTAKMGQKAASDYYKNMNQLHHVDPQFMDKQK